MVVKTAIQALKKAEELKSKLNQETDDVNKSLCLTQLQKTYQSILLTDLDYALNKKVEQDLWNIGFKNKIEFLQTCAKDKKNSRRVEKQILLSCALQSATGFYISLLNQICTAFHLGIPFRYKCSYPNDYKTAFYNISTPQPSSCWYICQYCLVHLGDLARYSRQPQLADSYYRQAISVSPDNGQPYNQLALLRAARGDKLGAAYYHARSLAVKGPFPLATNNLSQTLASTSDLIRQNMTTHLNAQSYMNSFLNFYYKLQSENNVDLIKTHIGELNSNLIALVATDEFKSETLNEMCSLNIALYFIGFADKKDLIMELIVGSLNALLLPVHTRASSEIIFYPALPAIKIVLEWIQLHPELLKNCAFVSRPQLWHSLCTLLTNLQKAMHPLSGTIFPNMPLPEDVELQGFTPMDGFFDNLKFTNVTIHIHTDGSNDDKSKLDDINEVLIENKLNSSEDLDKIDRNNKEKELEDDPQLVNKVRALRIIDLAVRLVSHSKNFDCNYINFVNADDVKEFTPGQDSKECNNDVMKQIEEISLLREKHLTEANNLKIKQSPGQDDYSDGSESENKQDNSPKCGGGNAQSSTSPEEAFPPPIVISEADFREKVKEKRVGILKPQGSLEKAREEKALSRANAVEISSPDMSKLHDESIPDFSIDIQDTGSSSSTVSQEGAICTDIGSLLDPPMFIDSSFAKKEGKKVRTNVAMQAIMRKQESQEAKQVKFITPATTPDLITENNAINESLNKKKILQPKAIKSINVLTTGKKTGGILSLKDKSAGYPHLVNIDSSIIDAVKLETDDSSLNLSSNNVNIPSLLDDEIPIKNLNLNPNNYTPWSDARTTNYVQNEPFVKPDNFGVNQNTECYSYFPQKPGNVNISFPDVVNPKEIDVRAVAMQKVKQYPNTYMKYDPNQRSRYDNVNPQNCWQYTDMSSISLLAESNIKNKINPNMNMLDNQPKFGTIGSETNYMPYNRFQDQGMNNPMQQSHIWWNPDRVTNEDKFGTPSTKNPIQKHPINNPSFQDNSFMNMTHRNNVYNDKSYNQFNVPPPPLYNPMSNQYYNQKFMFNQPMAQDNVPKNPYSMDLNNAPYVKMPEPISQMQHKFNTNIPEFVPKHYMNLDKPPQEQGNCGEGNTYSLFNGPQSSWQNKNIGTPQQSQWPNLGPTPLEKLLEQQKQFKYPPDDKKN